MCGVISYRELEEMMLERGFEVDHTTLYRWVQHYAPEMKKRMQWYYKPTMGCSWRVDETYVRVKGKSAQSIQLNLRFTEFSLPPNTSII